MDNIRNGTRNLGNMQKKNTETIYVLGETGFSDAIPRPYLATISQGKIPDEVGLRLAICLILNILSNINSILKFPTIYIVAAQLKSSKINLFLLKGNCPSSHHQTTPVLSRPRVVTDGFVRRCTTLTTINYGEGRYV